jgi:hypothetical protein
MDFSLKAALGVTSLISMTAPVIIRTPASDHWPLTSDFSPSDK